MDKSIPFKLHPLEDEDEISLLEYFLQVSFFTNDLHILNIWTFCDKNELDTFKLNSKKKYGGSILSFWADMNKLDPPQSFENSVLSGVLNVDSTNQLFEYGNPTGTFRMLLFKVAIGLVYDYSQESKNSNEMVINNDPKRFNSIYRIADADQALLYAVVEFEFTPLRVHVPEAICDMCESSLAKWYCHSDRAHFCTGCDMKQHGSTKIFSRHIRIPSSKSPNQFGLCEEHPTEVVDMVCLKHSLPDFFDHPLMSTLDTYELSLEKNSDSDEKLKFRRDELSNKIKNCHNSTSQIFANSKGVENKIDYCRKMLFQQLDEMKRKKINYLNSIQREINTQLNLIEWMQACQFIQFKAKYDLVVKKYFSKDLTDYLEFPVWMDKQLVLVGETKITTSAITKLSYSFSNSTPLQTVDSLVSVRSEAEDHSTKKLLDWTPLNLFDNMSETVRRVNSNFDNNGDKFESSSTVYTDTSDTVVLNDNKSVNEFDVVDTATKLWYHLSDIKMGTAIQLLKLVEVHERSLLVRHVFNISNYFEQLQQLFTHVSNYEMSALANQFGYCVLLRSSGLLSDVLSLLFCSNFSVEDNLGFLKQMTLVVDRYFNTYLNSVSSLSNHNDLNQTDQNCNDVDPTLKESVNNCMVEIVAKVVSLDIISLPTSFQYVMYSLTDLFSKLKFQYSCYIVVDFLCTVLSNYLLRYLNQYDMNNIFNANNASINNGLSDGNTDSSECDKYNKLKIFTRELSFRFARAAIVVWELDSVTFKDSYELKQSQKIYDWSEKMLLKPRVKCKLLLRNPTKEELNESINYVLKQLSGFEKRFNSGQLDISYKKANELTSKYNFFHLFKMANQIPI